MSNPASHIMAMAGNLEWLLEQERQAVVHALEDAGIEVPDCPSQSLLAGVEPQPDDNEQPTTKKDEPDA